MPWAAFKISLPTNNPVTLIVSPKNSLFTGIKLCFEPVLLLKLSSSGWEEAKKIILEDTADLLILDELNIVLATGMLPLEEVIDFLKKYKGKTEIITTGRGAPEELIDIADLVTDMQEIKHYFHKGVSSRDGIDH